MNNAHLWWWKWGLTIAVCVMVIRKVRRKEEMLLREKGRRRDLEALFAASPNSQPGSENPPPPPTNSHGHRETQPQEYKRSREPNERKERTAPDAWCTWSAAYAARGPRVQRVAP